MDNILTILRIANIFIWSCLLMCMAPGAWSVIRNNGGVRRGDPMRVGVAGVAIVMILANFRWLLAAENDLLFAVIYLLNAGVGLFMISLARTYGRGPRI